MQRIKFLIREVKSGEDSAKLEEHIAYNYSSKGYNIWKQVEYPVMDGGSLVGMRLVLTFVKEEAEQTETAESPVPEKKVGRPAKASA